MTRTNSALTILIACAMALSSAARAGSTFETAIAGIEARAQGRIGVFAMRGSRTVSCHAAERFAYCSVAKWVLVAAILEKAEKDPGRMVRFGPGDMVSDSPVTRTRLGEGSMGIFDLCAAAIEYSDNTAANLLEPLAGGPSGLQAFVRNLGDPVTRFDRTEPELNSNLPGDPRDTTTPEAMARLLRTVLETEALTQASRIQLLAWMKGARTGLGRIRAGAPRGWTVGDKTGTGGNGAANDVAVLFPPDGAPVYLCILTSGSDGRTREATIAEVARLALAALR